jgi:hypothetical protein
LETRLVVEAINDLQSLKVTCRLAFEGAQTIPSATQQQVSEWALRRGVDESETSMMRKAGCLESSAPERGRRQGRESAIESEEVYSGGGGAGPLVSGHAG